MRPKPLQTASSSSALHQRDLDWERLRLLHVDARQAAGVLRVGQVYDAADGS
jgi:hypothetical protein